MKSHRYFDPVLRLMVTAEQAEPIRVFNRNHEVRITWPLKSPIHAEMRSLFVLMGGRDIRFSHN